MCGSNWPFALRMNPVYRTNPPWRSSGSRVGVGRGPVVAVCVGVSAGEGDAVGVAGDPPPPQPATVSPPAPSAALDTPKNQRRVPRRATNRFQSMRCSRHPNVRVVCSRASPPRLGGSPVAERLTPDQVGEAPAPSPGWAADGAAAIARSPKPDEQIAAAACLMNRHPGRGPALRPSRSHSKPVTPVA